MNDFSLTNNINFLKEQCLTNRLIALPFDTVWVFLNQLFFTTFRRFGVKMEIFLHIVWHCK